MGGIGGLFNSILAPLSIKPFSGGPYADGGAGDRQQGNLDKYMAQLAPLIAQLAEMSGVVNPLTGQGNSGDQDSFGMNPMQQAALNQQQSIDTKAYDNMLSQVKANLTARGMGDSSTMAAAEVYLKQQLQNQMGSERIQAGQNAYQNKNQALGQIGQLLQGGYGEQQQVTAQQGATAEAAHSSAMSNLGNLLALGLYAGEVGPFGASRGGGGGGGGGEWGGGGGGLLGGLAGQGQQMPPVDWSRMGNIYTGSHF